MFVTFVTVVHVVACIFLMLVILLQAGKDAGMGAALGGGSQSVFGGRGAGSFLGRVTAICAAVFFMTSLTLSFAASYRPSVTSLIETSAPAAPSAAPVAPEQAAGGAAGAPAAAPAEEKPAPADAPKP